MPAANAHPGRQWVMVQITGFNWVPDAQVGDIGWVSSSWAGTALVLAGLAVRRVNQQVKD